MRHARRAARLVCGRAFRGRLLRCRRLGGVGVRRAGARRARTWRGLTRSVWCRRRRRLRQAKPRNHRQSNQNHKPAGPAPEEKQRGGKAQHHSTLCRIARSRRSLCTSSVTHPRSADPLSARCSSLSRSLAPCLLDLVPRPCVQYTHILRAPFDSSRPARPVLQTCFAAIFRIRIPCRPSNQLAKSTPTSPS